MFYVTKTLLSLVFLTDFVENRKLILTSTFHNEESTLKLSSMNKHRLQV